ncbi:MAG: hypothetical protein IEMM0002_0569 [bacterium]|nr:MAG: hypothetical protein IEMM0002_0569 [bacterium]
MAKKIKMGKPKMRLPRKIKSGQIIEVRVKIKFPSLTGLKLVDEEKNIFKREKPSVYLKKMDVFYGGQKITEYFMTSATSPDPLIRFKMRADKEAPVRIVFTNSFDQSAEVSKNLKFSG